LERQPEIEVYLRDCPTERPVAWLVSAVGPLGRPETTRDAVVYPLPLNWSFGRDNQGTNTEPVNPNNTFNSPLVREVCTDDSERIHATLSGDGHRDGR
jgi:hypothetical protein